MLKPRSINYKTPLIVSLALIAIGLCLFFSMRLIGSNNDISVSGENESLILRAVDGDTLELIDGELIRLLCVDTPESGEIGYEEAGNYLSNLILYGDENIRIERNGTDKYGRTLAWVYSSSDGNEMLINKEIIDKGYGLLFPYDGTDCSQMS